MAKELTLEELANSTNSNIKASESEPSIQETKTPKMNSGKNIGGQIISPSALGAHLRDVNGITTTETMTGEVSPVITNAFNAMTNELENRKKRIAEEVVPKIMENAEEMATAVMMGEDPFNTMLPDKPVENNISTYNDTPDDDIVIPSNNDSDDNTDTLSNDDINFDLDIDDFDFEDDHKKEDEINTYVEPEPVVENNKPKEITIDAPKFDVVEEDDDSSYSDDINDLDDLIKELNEDEITSSNNDDEDDTESAEEFRERVKESLETIKVSKNPVDLSTFKIRRTAVSSNSLLTSISKSRNSHKKKADWVLYHTGRSVTFMECSGPELNALSNSIRSMNTINGVMSTLKFVYDHIIDANKPAFEAWCKLIRTEDSESLYFGLYRACYADSNLVARYCTECKKTSLIDTDINTMVKFSDDETEKKFKALFNKDTTTENHDIKSTLIQISDDFAISYAPPTLYSTFIQYSSINENIQRKYAEILNAIAYIDGLYQIDRETNELVPVAIKEWPNNINKTVVERLKVFSAVFKTLTNDQYNILTTKLATLASDAKVTYIYPETTCPECDTKIPEEEIQSVIDLLFIRAQLAQVKSLS